MMNDEGETTLEESTEVDEPTQTLEGQTIHIPKQGEGYSIPDAGTALVSFEKVAEDENGCTIKITDFETEEDDLDSAESTRDQVDMFLNNQNSKAKSYE